jgi:serine/threonine protein kinase
MLIFPTQCTKTLNSRIPENIAINAEYQIKILDFGIARDVAEKMTTDPGSAGYKVLKALQKPKLRKFLGARSQQEKRVQRER